MLSRLIARVGAVAVVAAAAAASAQPWPPGPGMAAQPPQNSQTQLCQRLEAQLANIDRGASGDPARAEQIRRYEEASNRQQGELDRMTAQSRRAGCEGSGFFLFNALQSQNQQCTDLTRQISNMRGNLDRINVDLQRLRVGDVDRGEQRRSVVASLAQSNCGAQYRQAARQQGGFFDQLFGRDSGEAAPSGDLANPEIQGGSLRTVCVRTCDGYYFPISYATNASRFAQDEKTCQRLCPAAEVMLFSYATQGADITQATSINGQPYTALPNALKYRQEYSPSCTCKRPGQSWAEAVGKDEAVEPGDVVVTEDRAKQMAQPPAQKGQKGRAPAAGQPAGGATGSTTVPAAPPAAAKAETPAADGKKTIRAVGPTFIAPATTKQQ